MDDVHFTCMGYALEEAQKAFAKTEVPVGAVVIYGGEVIGRGHNQRETLQSPIAHAEILALEEAARRLKRWRLENASVYVTLEPCPMCAGAMVLARIKELYFALKDPKSGACGTLLNVANDLRLNHRIEVREGMRAEESLHLLQSFFKEQREALKYRPKII